MPSTEPNALVKNNSYTSSGLSPTIHTMTPPTRNAATTAISGNNSSLSRLFIDCSRRRRFEQTGNKGQMIVLVSVYCPLIRRSPVVNLVVISTPSSAQCCPGSHTSKPCWPEITEQASCRHAHDRCYQACRRRASPDARACGRSGHDLLSEVSLLG